jgi:hypothetical protein
MVEMIVTLVTVSDEIPITKVFRFEFVCEEDAMGSLTHRSIRQDF